jgi:DNA-binding winged helix-turn-helix (wHTH) protein
MTIIRIASGLLHGPTGAVPISRAPARLLQSFLSAPDGFLSVGELAASLWPDGKQPSSLRETMRQQIFRLRDHLRRVAPDARLDARRGWGWVLILPGAEESAPPE